MKEVAGSVAWLLTVPEINLKRHKRENMGHTVVLGTYIEIVNAVLSKV